MRLRNTLIAVTALGLLAGQAVAAAAAAAPASQVGDRVGARSKGGSKFIAGGEPLWYFIAFTGIAVAAVSYAENQGDSDKSVSP